MRFRISVISLWFFLEFFWLYSYLLSKCIAKEGSFEFIQNILYLHKFEILILQIKDECEFFFNLYFFLIFFNLIGF